MAAEQTSAIVLRVVEFSETSCIVTLFTREFGKIGVLAKGARRRKSPFEGALDLLSICRIVFLRKSTDALHILTEARLERWFRAAQRDLGRFYAAMYVAELLNELNDVEDPHPRLFDLAAQTLAAIDQREGPRWWLLRFQLGLLADTGHGPSLDHCVVCGKPLAQETPGWFSLGGGGVVCDACRPGQRTLIRISPESKETMQQMAREMAAFDHAAAATAAARDRLHDRAAESGARRGGLDAALNSRHLPEASAILDQYIAHVLGHRPRLAAYVKQYLRN
jgi:DNA repair protein RecO (recombination protein O)